MILSPILFWFLNFLVSFGILNGDYDINGNFYYLEKNVL